jgi:site-specific DNA recombinase
MTSSLRVLGRIRLSKDQDDSGTSIERQRESIEQWSKMHGHVVTSWAVDSGVSGSISPFDTPELGPWLTAEKLPDWDVLVAYRLDRLSRRVIPLNELFGFVQRHGKTLASVSESLDLSTWIGRLVANVIAGVAEGELEAARERNLGSQKTVRQLGRWHGGTLPYGYTTDHRQDGHYLVPDPEERRVIREEILPRVLAHQSSHSIARDLNDAGIPPRKGGVWNALVIRKMIRGRWLLGENEHRGKLITDENGMPALRAEPILTSDEHQRAVAALAARTVRISRKQANPLGGVLFCYLCEAPMYLQSDTRRGNASYRCAKRAQGCKCRGVRSDTAYELVEDAFLSAVGDVERRAKVFAPGRDNRQSVADIEAAIAVCRRERDLGLYDKDDEAYFERLKRLVARRDELQQLPVSAGFEWKDLGETYAQAWKTINAEQRRTLLLDSNIRVYIGRGEGNQFYGRIYVPEEIEELLTA